MWPERSAVYSSKRKKDIIRVFVVLGIVRMLRNLGSLRMIGFVRCMGGGKYKIS